MINCHVHLFTIRSVPSRFFGPALVMKLLWTVRGKKFVFRFLRWLSRRTGSRRFERMAAFSGIGSHESQKDIFNILQGYYPSDAEFIVLPMDFEFMGAGVPRQSYLDQLEELKKLKQDADWGSRIHPFVAIDPRRPNFLELAKDLIENHHFEGIKLYPALGFFPGDNRMNALWEWAEAKQIPVMTHASRGGVYYRGRASDISWPDGLEMDMSRPGKASQWTDHLSDPAAFQPVLSRYPNLKVCFAHMGGGDECEQWLLDPWPDHLSNSNWLTVILGLIKAHPNVYTDLSFVGYEAKLHALMHVLIRDPAIGNRILFGSDFYMVQQDATEREFSIRLRSLLSEDEYRRISQINPQQYLKRA